MLVRSFGMVFGFLTFVAACGSEVTQNPNGTGGAGGSGAGGASSSSSASSSSGSGGAGTCPIAPPTPGGACSLPEGQTCQYGDTCCPLVFECSQGMWNGVDIDCVVPLACPETPPANGSACDSNPCLQAAPCGYECKAGVAVFSECVGGAWKSAETPCAGTLPCGSVDCAPGEICVEKAGGAGIFFHCEANPCLPGALSCACAQATICGGPPNECAMTGSSQISCSCNICP